MLEGWMRLGMRGMHEANISMPQVVRGVRGRRGGEWRVTVYLVVRDGRVVMVWDTEQAERKASQLHDFLGWWKDMEPWDQIIKIASKLEDVKDVKV